MHWAAEGRWLEGKAAERQKQLGADTCAQGWGVGGGDRGRGAGCAREGANAGFAACVHWGAW